MLSRRWKQSSSRRFMAQLCYQPQSLRGWIRSCCFGRTCFVAVLKVDQLRNRSSQQTKPDFRNVPKVAVQNHSKLIMQLHRTVFQTRNCSRRVQGFQTISNDSAIMAITSCHPCWVGGSIRLKSPTCTPNKLNDIMLYFWDREEPTLKTINTRRRFAQFIVINSFFISFHQLDRRFPCAQDDGGGKNIHFPGCQLI